MSALLFILFRALEQSRQFIIERPCSEVYRAGYCLNELLGPVRRRLGIQAGQIHLVLFFRHDAQDFRYRIRPEYS